MFERNTLLTRFLITSDIDDRGVCRDKDDDDPAADVSDNDDNNDDTAADTAADDPDDDANVSVGFDDDGDNVDKYTNAPACNTAADDKCDGDDGNGEGRINDKGDCDSDCNRAEC